MNNNYITTYVDFEGHISYRKLMKRVLIRIFTCGKFIFDRLFAFLGIIISLPLMIIIAIAIKKDSRGTILFKQERTGKNGKTFTLYKFRTMVKNNDVHDFTKPDEYTKIGKILRKTSLDEIPQLFSILIGKMSFIGPRPWITDYYDNMNDIQRQRYIVRPGLTGLAQCMGRNNISVFDKIQYDITYIKNYSLLQDIKIIILTIKCVFVGNGADAGKDVIEKELKALKNQK